MRILIVIILALAVYGFIVESRKRRRRPAELAPGERLTPADDMPPTETGKYRVKLALGEKPLHGQPSGDGSPGSPAKSAPAHDPGTLPVTEEENPLPDPFGGSQDKG